MNYEEITDMIGALAHPTRYQIIKLLSEEGSSAVELAQAIGRGATEIMPHLESLRGRGLIIRKGRKRHYTYHKISDTIIKISNAIGELQ